MSYNPKIDYYETIGGITPSSNIKEIKKAYRKKALEYHPDKNPGKEDWAKSKFLELKEIYETLIDKDKKTKYDKERDKYLSTKKTVNYEGRPGWTYTTDQNSNSVNFDPIPRTFVKSRPYVAYDYAKNSKQTLIRIIVYSSMFIMVLVTIYMLSILRQ
ncbi:MAG: DnaJ domain-containing protein [Candidatus Methanofastidiosa archaeon]|nr:DnaJ domain-containing protein [Candidatus Methanofastidiosa archaeon]NYT13839.1 DnaJ domain-containing protein [Candidatus Methanofastidiosa archaeon]